MILPVPKQIGPDQNNLYPTKIIWLVQNHFGPIEGQGISIKCAVYMTLCSAGLLKESCYKLYKNADFQFFHLV